MKKPGRIRIEDEKTKGLGEEERRKLVRELLQKRVHLDKPGKKGKS